MAGGVGGGERDGNGVGDREEEGLLRVYGDEDREGVVDGDAVRVSDKDGDEDQEGAS